MWSVVQARNCRKGTWFTRKYLRKRSWLTKWFSLRCRTWNDQEFAIESVSIDYAFLCTEGAQPSIIQCVDEILNRTVWASQENVETQVWSYVQIATILLIHWATIRVPTFWLLPCVHTLIHAHACKRALESQSLQFDQWNDLPAVTVRIICLQTDLCGFGLATSYCQ